MADMEVTHRLVGPPNRGSMQGGTYDFLCIMRPRLSKCSLFEDEKIDVSSDSTLIPLLIRYFRKIRNRNRAVINAVVATYCDLLTFFPPSSLSHDLLDKRSSCKPRVHPIMLSLRTEAMPPAALIQVAPTPLHPHPLKSPPAPSPPVLTTNRHAAAACRKVPSRAAADPGCGRPG